MQVVEREAMHLSGLTTRGPLSELPTTVPPLWREVFARHDGEAVLAELSEEPGDGLHVITVGVLSTVRAREGAVPDAEVVVVPAGRWLHHEHRGPLAAIGRTYGEMFTYARTAGLRVTDLKLDVGYRPDGAEDKHDLFLLVAQGHGDSRDVVPEVSAAP
ncbi:MAG TPA: GyrI-like domain-containing protein [Intrasporangium sp.]|nr:GyrI-like domain-containing protein [Intrasporangium sp.]